MPHSLLTIIVPTYNRAECLSLLLARVQHELAGLEDRVQVIVGDNASSDHTVEVVASFAGRFTSTRHLRHPENVGADENFCRCLDQTTSKYFWIIGDDDLPRTGTVAAVVGMLESCDPDLLFLGSEWLPELTGSEPGLRPDAAAPVRVTSEEFAGYVNVWVTFISGMVVNRDRLLQLQPEPALRRFAGTSLVQLGWVLPLLMHGERLFVFAERCMLATSGNTGGYKLITVFATNLPAILDAVCGRASVQRRRIVRALAWAYVPSLLWITRYGESSRFSTEDVRGSLRPLRTTAAYPFVLAPVLDAPKPLAFVFWTLSRICGKAIRLFFASKFALRQAPKGRAGIAGESR